MRHQRCLPFLLALALCSFAPGCAFSNWCSQRFGPPAAPCVLRDDSTQADVVNHLNDNTKKLLSWRATRAFIKIHGQGIIDPPKVGAMIAVESPRNFRLVASTPLGNEADLGSNQEHFWFWNKHNEEKYVYQAQHDLEPERMRRFPFPFQPDWIMESLGVIEIDTQQPLTMQPGPAGSHIVFLTADRLSPQGLKVRKVTAVDLCLGVVREHALYDARGDLIARAVLRDHAHFRNIRNNGQDVVLPRAIDLEWPQAKLNLTMTFSEIEVNPENISRGTWDVPKIRDYPIRDMTQ